MIKHFFKDSIIYAIPSILTRGVAFILLPVYTHYLSPSEYGAIELLTLTFALLNIVLPLEITQAVARLLPETENRLKSSLASTAFWFTFASFMAFVSILWFFSSEAALFLLGNASLSSLIRLAAFAMLANALFYLMQNQLRWSLQPRAYSISGLTFSFTMAATSVTLVAAFNMGLKGVILGQLSGSIIGLFSAFYFSRATIPIKFDIDMQQLKEMLAFSSPLILSSIAVYFTLFTDRWLLRELMSIDDVGVYSVAYRLASITSLVIIAFQMPLVPLIYHNYKKAETAGAIGEIFAYYLALLLPLVLLLSLFSNEIVFFVSPPDFQEAAVLIPLLTISVVLMNIYFFSPGLGLAKKTGTKAIINIIAAIINIILNFVWITEFGRIGAAMATFCSAATLSGLMFWLGNREYAITYRTRRITIAFSIILLFIFFPNITPSIWYGKLILWISASAAIVSTLITKEDLNKISCYFSKPASKP